MAKLPPLELIEATHRFPGPYLFKIVGNEAEGFVHSVVAAIRVEMGYEADPAYTVRRSAGGNHVAITVELSLENAKDAHRVYHALLAVPGIIVLL